MRQGPHLHKRMRFHNLKLKAPTLNIFFMAKYSEAAQQNVESAMKRMEKGTLKSGRSGKKVTNPKQAIAIGLSEAREKRAKAPPPPKKSTAKKTTRSR